MKKWLVAVVLLGWSNVALRADITVTQTITAEGPAAVLMPAGQLPTITIRIKGMKARTEVETFGQTVTTITDLETKQVMVLRPGSTVAQVLTPETASAGAPAQTFGIELSLAPTGRARRILAVSCDEQSFTMRMNVASIGNPHVPPEAMRDATMLMRGSIWIAKSPPGAAEWIAFTRAALDSRLLPSFAGLQTQPGLQRLLEASVTAGGIPCLVEMTTRYEGSGPMVDIMKEMGAMKMTQRITAVSTSPIAEELFTLPAGYTLDKR